MKIGMQTWGSHGDIRPFLALAEGLQATGHDVTLLITCTDSVAYQNIQSLHGVKIVMVASPILSPEQGKAIALDIRNTLNPMAQLEKIYRLCWSLGENEMFEAAQKLCADADLLIGHFIMHPLQIAAEKAGLPYVSVTLSQCVVPSALQNPIGISLGHIGNRLLWWLTRVGINQKILHYPNRLRRQLGMPLAQDILTQVWMSQQLTLLAVSPQICQRPADWPAHIQVCGFLDMPNLAQEGIVPEALAAFLQAGDAPVYMTFGSWMPTDISNQTSELQLLTQAARLAGCRAIIQSPSWQECGFKSCKQILYVSAAPHHLIFPHCRAVLHHGGAGTTQSATLAGKPSIVVANIAEQIHWGLELRRLCIAGKPARRRGMHAEKLARQIRAVLNAPEMNTKAQAIASAMKLENGVAQAVKLIDKKFASKELLTR